MQMNTIVRPPRDLVDGLKGIGTATASGELYKLGIRDPHLKGPAAFVEGKAIAGPALTLQFMPKREDIYGDDEYGNPEAQLHRHVLYQVEAGDVVVVDARGDMASGVFGEMMLTYFKGRGGAGIVVDGCIRDSAEARKLDLPLWVRGTTPNFHTQTRLMPFGVNVPIACGDVMVMPGDIIIADDDGVVCVPIALAGTVLDNASHHVEWEEFSRLRLSEGADLRKYYPLREDAEEEYRNWSAAQGAKTVA